MLPVTHTNQFRPIAVIAVLLLVSLLSSGTTWAKSPSWCNFDPGCVGKRVTPASGPNLCLASTPEFAMQSVLYDSITKARSKWPDNAHGWGKAAIYGLEFAGAAIPIYGSFALMPVLIPKGENVVQDPDAGFTAFTLFTAGQLVGPSMTMEVGRLLHQQGDVPNTCIGCCSGLLLATAGVLATSALSEVPALIVAIPLVLLQPALTVIGYNSHSPRPRPKTPAQQSRETEKSGVGSGKSGDVGQIHGRVEDGETR